MVSDFNRLTCADPLTGWSTAEHLSSQLSTLFAQASEPGDVSDHFVLLVLDIEPRAAHRHRTDRPFARALSLAVVADSLDAWFDDPPVAQATLGPARVALLMRREGDVDRTAVEISTYVTSRLRLSPVSPTARERVVVLPRDLPSSIALIRSLTS